MLKTIEIDLLYQGLIDAPPPHVGNLYQNSCMADGTTVNHWKDIWIKNYRSAKDIFGSFGDKSIGKLYGINKHKPAIVIGSGPSLKNSIEALKINQELDQPLLTISCLHNLGYFEDEGVKVDYFLTLDSGKIVVDDISEGRKDSNYWEKTKGKKLLAITMTDPEVFEKWQGEIYLFNCLIPDLSVREEFNKIERFAHYVSSGGNALGACMYVAKAIMGSDAIHYVGADFCFDYNNQFHSYKTHYDSVGNYIMWVDVFGIPRKTWQSYLAFKFWFDHIAMNFKGKWINCSQGLLGAYREGNLKHFQYMDLKSAILSYKASEVMVLQKIEIGSNKVLSEDSFKLKDLYSDPLYKEDLVLF